jgi:hypothetical protein
MGSADVVVGDELLEEGLQLIEGCWLGGLGGQFFIVCWKRSALPQVAGPADRTYAAT